MSSTSLGFSLPAPDSISVLDYDVSINGTSLRPDKSAAAGIAWTPQSTVDATFEIDLDTRNVLRECAISGSVDAEEDSLAAVINWKSTRTGLHGASDLKVLNDGVNNVTVKLDGSQLGGDLVLRIAVVLLKNPDQFPNAVAPTRLGSRLWEQTIKVQLEGDGSQFPVSAFDFKSTGFEPGNAMWKLDVSGDLDSHVSSAIRLKLNTGHPRIADYLANPEARENSEFGEFLRTNAIAQLLIYALNQDVTQLKLDAEESGTLAETLIQLHDTYFPSTSVEATKENFIYDPSIVYSTVQASVFKARKKKTK